MTLCTATGANCRVTNCGGGLPWRSVTAAGKLDSCTWQQDIAWEEQSIFIPDIFLQHSFDSVAVRFAGTMHASKGAATARYINNTVNTETHRRILRLYPASLSDASDVNHIFRVNSRAIGEHQFKEPPRATISSGYSARKRCRMKRLELILRLTWGFPEFTNIAIMASFDNPVLTRIPPGNMQVK